MLNYIFLAYVHKYHFHFLFHFAFCQHLNQSILFTRHPSKHQTPTTIIFAKQSIGRSASHRNAHWYNKNIKCNCNNVKRCKKGILKCDVLSCVPLVRHCIGQRILSKLYWLQLSRRRRHVLLHVRWARTR